MTVKNPSCMSRLDFISVTNIFESLDDCEEAITGVAVFVRDGDGWGYLQDRSTRFKSVAGLMGWIKKTDDWYHLRLELPGEFCKCVDQLSLCQYLDSKQFRCTRLDIALDDYKRRVDFNTVKAAGDSGSYMLVEYFKSIQSSILCGADPVGTCYFGNSDKILRFYNAQAVHGIEADRWELQLRSDIAQSAFDIYLDDSSYLPSLVVGAVDFGIRGSHYDKFTRFPWWESLIEDAGFPYPIPRTSYEPDLSRTIDWLNTAVAPSLLVLRNGLGSQFDTFLNQLCSRATSRLKPYQHEWIKTIQKSEIDVLKILQECSK